MKWGGMGGVGRSLGLVHYHGSKKDKTISDEIIKLSLVSCSGSDPMPTPYLDRMVEDSFWKHADCDSEGSNQDLLKAKTLWESEDI